MTTRLLSTALALGMLACAPTARAPERESALDLHECLLPKVSDKLLCGTWQVPENRALANGRQIGLHVVVAPALEPGADSTPVFYLQGGPGQGTSDMAHIILNTFYRTNKTRPLVLLDPRGTGRSGKLACEDPGPEDLAAQLDLRVQPELIAKCLADLDADTTQYTTPQHVADIDAVRAALGYEKIHIYGVSYGSRAGLAYIASHEDRVVSAVLDGLAPYAMKLFLPFAADGKRALDRLFADCADDADCNAAFPGLAERFWPWLASLRDQDPQAPTLATVRAPSSGQLSLDVPVTFAAVSSAIRSQLYSIDMARLLPLALDRAIAGDLQPLYGQGLVLGQDVADLMAPGLMMSVACAEDLSRISQAERDALLDEPFLGPGLLDMIRDSCARWKFGEVPDSLFEPVRSDLPILLLSGAEDPVTPERWAIEAARTLGNATLVTVPATSHGVAGAGCADKLIRNFYNSPQDHGFDLERDCLDAVQRPSFFVDFSGPVP